MSLFSDTKTWLKTQAPEEPEYFQAVEEILGHIVPIVNANEVYKRNNVLERILIPQHVHQFSVLWENDDGECEVNTGWRVQHSNVLGPFKGGTRFDPNVNLATLKFLAFEQTFKNALTGLLLGSGKGGANFDPKCRSESEIRRFGKSYISALQNHIGATTDVPAGDINVSEREIGFMFGEMLRQNKRHESMLSGKPLVLGGSKLRVQATGYGVMYFVESMLAEQNKTIASKSICISGAGNVALYTAKKANEMEATVLTLSNSKGVFYVQSGITDAHIDWLIQNKNQYDNALDELAAQMSGEFLENQKPWDVECDIAIPCATQNEIERQDAEKLLLNVSLAVIEGANMPCDKEATALLSESDSLFVPGKAANAGGVIVSAFEMQQHTTMQYEPESKLNERLQLAMQNIQESCVHESKVLGNTQTNYIQGANVRSFRRLADAIVASGY